MARDIKYFGSCADKARLKFDFEGGVADDCSSPLLGRWLALVFLGWEFELVDNRTNSHGESDFRLVTKSNIPLSKSAAG